MDQPKIDPQQLAQQLLAQAKADGVELVGPNGLLNQLTATVLETALEAEMDEHLGYEKHQVEGRNTGNSRNGRRSKTVLTEIGPVQIQVPRDTDASFDPQIVKKRQRRLTGVDEIILSLSAKGLTTGEIAAHFDDVYGATVSKETISKITDKVLAEMAEWSVRPLDSVYPVPIASRQDAREVCFVASSDDARVATAVTAGTRAGPALAMVRVSSSAVNAWICRWIAAGFRRT
nr:transposase [Rhodococcus rhodochrous]